MPRVIYMDTDTNLGTWRHIAEAGNYVIFTGRANRGDVIIRWGCNHGRYQGHYPEGTRVLNKRIILGKIEQGHALQDAGVSIPKIYTSVVTWERDGRPELLRKPNIGQMGTGIVRVTRPAFNRTNALYQKFINKDREFRAMMVGELMAFFMEKHPPQNGDFRWNEHRGAEWTTVGEERGLRTRVRQIGHAALKAIDYDFGAVDIIMKDNVLYVLEVNSRPEFGERNAEHFAHAIQGYLERD